MLQEKIYSIPTLAFFAVLIIGWYISSIVQYRAKLAKLGGKAPLVPYYIPFGWDTLWNTIQVA